MVASKDVPISGAGKTIAATIAGADCTDALREGVRIR